MFFTLVLTGIGRGPVKEHCQMRFGARHFCVN